jgi:PfaB family protein
MDLIISGMALSYQWWPSLKHFENSLAGGEKPLPSLVEHCGEVIQQAITGAGLSPSSHLTLIHDPTLADLGHYLPLIEADLQAVALVKPDSELLGSRIRQAGELIGNDGDHHVLICDLSGYGSTALLLSHPDRPGGAHARIRFPGDAGADPTRADFIMLPGSPHPTDGDSIGRLRELFKGRKDNHPVALAYSVAASALSLEMLSLVQAVLAVKLGTIPGSYQPESSGWYDFGEDLFYFNREFHPWLSRGQEFKRVALQLFRSPGNDPEFAVLEECGDPLPRITIRHREGSDPYLIFLSGDEEDELQSCLDWFERLIQGQQPLSSIANDAYTNCFKGKKAFICSLMARNREEIHKELTHARDGITQAFQSGKAWTSPGGSYFTPLPLGPGGIALVFPGAFNSYPGMGRELFFSFPGLSDAAREWIPDPGHSLAEEFLYLRSSRSEPGNEDALMAEFYQHPVELIESGISLSVLHTQILSRLFDLHPEFALGYSLGEISMLWATRVWQNAEESSASWMESNLFQDQLFGEMQAVRGYWQGKDLPDDFWVSFILKALRNQVAEACSQEEMAFLSMVNTDQEVVIAGEREACQRVIQKLGCHSIPMPFNAVIHNPTMAPTRPAFRKLYSHPTHPVPGMRFYSAASYQQLALSQDSLADAMATMTTSPIDFPRLVEKAYSEGARIFIEVGPQKTCSRWIENILGDKPHAVIPINKKYQHDLTGVLKVVSMLVSHGAEINLEALYPALGQIADQEPKASKEVPPPPEDRSRPLQPVRVREKIAPELKVAYLDHLAMVSADLSSSHQLYLQKQRDMTRNLARLMEMQASIQVREMFPERKSSPLYSRDQIEAFTSGDHRVCFGNTFSGFGSRRIPRLPNGDLQFIDRVISIQGRREQVAENSALVSEFDLPDTAWYRNGSSAPLSHISLMELALQPCGFLSAYMGSIRGRESQDLYFRNLDGEGTLLGWPESPPRTLSNRVVLLSSSELEDVIIQKYSFQLSWGGSALYRGTSSFGYFPHSMLESQAGLDRGHHTRTWLETHPDAGAWTGIPARSESGSSASQARMPVVERLWISPAGGKHSSGYVYLTQQLSGREWFYQAHFYQDPVMPGSLGVETIARGMMAAAPAWDVPAHLQWRIKPGIRMVWKYRGQITPDIGQIRIEIHLKSITRTSSGWEIRADGDLWKGPRRIYQVEDISLESC